MRFLVRWSQLVSGRNDEFSLSETESTPIKNVSDTKTRPRHSICGLETGLLQNWTEVNVTPITTGLAENKMLTITETDWIIYEITTPCNYSFSNNFSACRNVNVSDHPLMARLISNIARNNWIDLNLFKKPYRSLSLSHTSLAVNN